TIPDSDKYTFAFFPAFSPLVGLTFASSFCCGRKDISEHKESPQGQNISLQPNHPENHRTAHTGTGQKLIPKLLTLTTDKSGGFSVRPPQPASARSYTVSPSV